ncbi:Lovastatin diketide synthase [Fusarium globosum]|uniref:Lovastatin diketide synthase n=1 Tax=Fusarium globosum TaxID=78864 RepID=A0A8H6CUW8_9HYPO|nr:Lovastatin diketide synthase [Fusarium globosum]
MAFTLPAQLTGGLTEREAIGDALYRAVLAFDYGDEALLLSAITEDIDAEMPGSTAHGIAEFKAAVFDRVSKLDTTHFLSNLRVNIASSSTATATCSALAQHVRPRQGADPSAAKFTSGAFYACDMVKIGHLWKMKTWKASIIWLDGDPAVLAG